MCPLTEEKNDEKLDNLIWIWSKLSVPKSDLGPWTKSSSRSLLRSTLAQTNTLMIISAAVSPLTNSQHLQILVRLGANYAEAPVESIPTHPDPFAPANHSGVTYVNPFIIPLGGQTHHRQQPGHLHLPTLIMWIIIFYRFWPWWFSFEGIWVVQIYINALQKHSSQSWLRSCPRVTLLYIPPSVPPVV